MSDDYLLKIKSIWCQESLQYQTFIKYKMTNIALSFDDKQQTKQQEPVLFKRMSIEYT
jgi:hypothetical protein